MMKDSSKRLRHVVLCTIVFLLAGRAWSQKPQIVGQERPGTVQDWEQRIGLAKERLDAGDFKKAQNISEGLVREMLHTIESGPGVGPLVGQTLVLRALGAAGRNKMREALWDWHSARAMNPKLTDADLGAYGPVGEALLAAYQKENRPQRPPEGSARAASAPKITGNVTRPAKTKGELPVYPRALYTACTQGSVVTESIIDLEGYVTAPAPLSSPNPILTLAALETLRSWRFKPARFKGEPVAVYYTLTLGFRAPCRNPAAVAAQDRDNG